MSELARTIVFFLVLLAVFIGCILVIPTVEGRVMMGAVALFSLYGVARKITALWLDR